MAKVGRPMKFESAEQLKSLIDNYFNYCDENKKPYTITGLALSLGTNRETLCNYEEKEEFFDAIKEAKTKCEQWVEENAMIGKANATFAIFNLKNNYGWKDKNETDITTGGEKLNVSVINYDNTK